MYVIPARNDCHGSRSMFFYVLSKIREKSPRSSVPPEYKGKPFHPHLISHLENRFNRLAWSIARVCYRLHIYLIDFRNLQAKFSRSAKQELFSLNLQTIDHGN